MENTLSVWPVKGPRSAFAAVSQSLPSALVLFPFLAGLNSLPPADARSLPSGENATEQTQSFNGAGPGSPLPLDSSTILTVLQAPTARVLPSGENARAELRSEPPSTRAATAGCVLVPSASWSAAREAHTRSRSLRAKTHLLA